jgi:hypothetical protein
MRSQSFSHRKKKNEKKNIKNKRRRKNLSHAKRDGNKAKNLNYGREREKQHVVCTYKDG